MMRPNTSDSVYLSLIIPAFNEATRIGKSLEQILGFLKSQLYSFEVIVVDDGSSDGTSKLIHDRYGKESCVRLHEKPIHRGKGAAVQDGMLQAKGRFVFFSDADLSVPIETIPSFLSHLQNGCGIAIASRRRRGAIVERHQPAIREFLGGVFTGLSNWILALQHSDLTCGFKGFRQEIAKELFSQQRLDNWSFDSEILYLAKIKGYRVAEVPVTWRHDAATKVRLSRDAVSSLLGLLFIRVNHCLGRYS